MAFEKRPKYSNLTDEQLIQLIRQLQNTLIETSRDLGYAIDEIKRRWR